MRGNGSTDQKKQNQGETLNQATDWAVRFLLPPANSRTIQLHYKLKTLLPVPPNPAYH